MRRLQWILAFAAVVGLSGCCSKSPASMCEKYMELRKEAKLSTEKPAVEACQASLSGLEERSSEAWKCASGCIARAETSAAADQCPISCETQYGNDGESFEGDADTAVRKRWENGISGDTGKAASRKALGDSIAGQAAQKARILEACVVECKPKHEVGTSEYKSCLNKCQVFKLLEEAKEGAPE
jgi:hypothetical protein